MSYIGGPMLNSSNNQLQNPYNSVFSPTMYQQKSFSQFDNSGYFQQQKFLNSAPTVASSVSSEQNTDMHSTLSGFVTSPLANCNINHLNSFPTAGYQDNQFQMTGYQDNQTLQQDNLTTDFENLSVGQSVVQETGKNFEDGSAASTANSVPMYKPDPAQGGNFQNAQNVAYNSFQNNSMTTSENAFGGENKLEFHPSPQGTSFSHRGQASAAMAELSLSVWEYAAAMDPQQLNMFASKCLADESGFVLVFHVSNMEALAIVYFRTGNMTVCDIVFTTATTIVSSNPAHFIGNFVCMLRRTKNVMNQNLKNVVVDDILCCRPWFQSHSIEFNRINPVLSDVSIVCGGTKAVCVEQTLNVHFAVNAVNPSTLFFHPEAKAVKFSPEMVIIPAMSSISLPVKMTPQEGCNLRPHIRVVLNDLFQNEEKFGLSTPFIVLPQIPPRAVIRGYEVIYVDDDKTCLRILDEINMLASGFVFLDTEWKPMNSKSHNKIALIQICVENKAYLIHICKFRDRIPQALYQFLASPRIIKIGLAIAYDAKKFQDDYRHPIKPVVDIRDFTWFDDRDKKSLNFLVQNILNLPNRTKKCTLSNWEHPILNELQVEYAALDVIYMAEIFEHLFGPDKTMQTYAILTLSKRKGSITQKVQYQPPTPQKPEKVTERKTEGSGSISLVDSSGKVQYNITKKRAQRLLMLHQAQKVSENVLQLIT
jgi:hypothetical protein